MLPFTAEILFAQLAQYNGAVWPAQIVANGMAVVAIALVLRRVPGGCRLIGASLAAAWVWNGVVYYLMHLATIDFSAPIFALFCIVEGLLIAWGAVIRGRISFRFRPGPAGWTGLGLAIFAMAGYPLLGWLAGHSWPCAALVGVTPGPTALFTIGMLLLTGGRTPLHLVIIPLFWSLIAGATAWILDIREDLVLPMAGIGGLLLVLWKNRKHPRRRQAKTVKPV